MAKDVTQTAKPHHDTHHDEVPLKPNEIKLLQMLSSRGDLGAADLRKAMKLRNAPDFRERYLRPLSRNVDRSLQTDSENFGSPELTEAISEKRPRFVFCGHIHTGLHGGVDFEDSRIYNVSRLDERYEIAYEPTWVGV